MILNEIVQRLNKIENLPTLPAIYTRIEKAIRAPDSNSNTIASIINDDPAIMTRIMKIVNSAFYSVPGVSISSLEQAITRLGMQAVNNIVLSTSVFSIFRPQTGSLYWTGRNSGYTPFQQELL